MISTETAAPVIAAMRLRAGRSGSGKGAARMVAQAVATARAAGVTGEILARGDSAYGTRAVVDALSGRHVTTSSRDDTASARDALRVRRP